MRIVITTPIEGWTLEDAMLNFNRKLLNQLLPAFPKANIVRYDGNHEGSEVHIMLYLPWGKKLWVSHIIAEVQTEKEYYFIDSSENPPAPLNRWRHKHLLRQGDGKVLIIDDINFSCPVLLKPFVYIGLYVQFAMRRPVYQRYYSLLTKTKTTG